MLRWMILLLLLTTATFSGCSQPNPTANSSSPDAEGRFGDSLSLVAPESWPSDQLTPASNADEIDPASSMVIPANAVSAASGDTVVVGRDDWRSLMQPWIDYRQAQGHQVDWLSIPDSPQTLKQQLASRYAMGLRYVLLLGDIPAAGNGVSDQQGIWTGVVDSEVSQRFGGPDLVASDNWYADFDGDHAPEIAIGRWAVDRPQQVKDLIRKTIDFETNPDVEFAKRQIEFVAGVGGFGFLEDKVIETTASRLLTDLLPGHHQVNMTHASWRSVYCPGPDQYQDKFFASLNRGALFWVYMGHGSPSSLDFAEFPDRRVATLNVRNTDRLNSPLPSIALMLACSTGQFAGPQDCLAEDMVAAPNGPVAALAGTGVTAPYGLASFGFELLSSYRHDRPKVLGDWLVRAKRTMLSVEQREEVENSDTQPLVTQENENASRWSRWKLSREDYRNLLRQLAGLFSPTSDMLSQELAEHCEMMTLFGDPLLRLPQYQDIHLQANANADGTLQVSGNLEQLDDTEVQLEIVHPLDRLSFRPKPRNKYDRSAEFHEQFESTYTQANNRIIQKAVVTSLSGKFSISLKQLGQLPGKVLVRAFVNNEACQALGFCEVQTTSVTAQEETSSSSPDDSADDTTNSDKGSDEDDPFEGKWEADGFLPDGQPISVYNRKSLDGWKLTNFGGEKEVYVRDDGDLEIETGYPMTGITFAGTDELPLSDLPKENYELQMRVQKVEGGDFFAGLTFPVGDEFCSFIAGGWGGTTVGLSSVDEKDAARNETRSVHKFPSGKWYLIRIRVTNEKVECWIDQQKVVTQNRADHKFSIRGEVRLSKPLGFCNFQTQSRISHFRLLKIKPVEPESPGESN